MPDTETTVVFRILGILANAHDRAHSLLLNDIADAANLDRSRAQRFMDVLEKAAAVRSEHFPLRAPAYCLTRYGRERLRGCATSVTNSV